MDEAFSQQSRGGTFSEDGVFVFGNLEIVVAPEAVVRFLGYPAGANPGSAIAGLVLRAIEIARPIQKPRAILAIMPRGGAGDLPLSATSFLGGSERVAALAATAGPEIEHLASGATGESERLVLDAIGSVLAGAAAASAVEDVRRRLGPGEALSMQYSPGFCGAPVEDQRLLMRLVDAARIGVELLPSGILRPLKSVTGLVGIGPTGRVPPFGNPCDLCALERCGMRRSGIY